MKLKVSILSFLFLFALFIACSDTSRPPYLKDYIKDATADKSFPDVSIPCDVDLSMDVQMQDVSFEHQDIPDAAPDIETKEASTGNGIYYHGGPIMAGTVNVYYIWYGNWAKNQAAKDILIDFMKNFGGSRYYDLNTTYYSVQSNTAPSLSRANMFKKPKNLRPIGGVADYDEHLMLNKAPINYDGPRTYVSNSVNYVGSCDDNYSYGLKLDLKNMQDLVKNTFTKGIFPVDPNGVYFILTTADVDQNYDSWGFCSSFCGWHHFFDYNDVTIKYSFVGDTTRCPGSCSGFLMKGDQYLTPNNNLTADGMASVLAHELEEATSDPMLDSWFDYAGWENADKCAWSWGEFYYTANGAKANMKLGNRDYLIQENWVNEKGGYCGLSR